MKALILLGLLLTAIGCLLGGLHWAIVTNGENPWSGILIGIGATCAFGAGRVADA